MHRLLIVPVLLSIATASAFAGADAGLLGLVPANSKVVSSINVDQARNSPFGQYMLSKMTAQGHGFDQMAAETGFDPRRDLQTVVFASSSPELSQTGNHSSNFVVLMRGTFDAQRIQTLMLSHKGQRQSLDGVDIYLDGTGDKNAFALAEPDIAVMGDRSSVQQVIANRGIATVLDPPLQTLISQVSAENDAWFASVLPNSVDLVGNMSKGAGLNTRGSAAALQGVRQAAGGLHFADTVQITLEAVTRSPQDANALGDFVRFMGSLVQAQYQSSPQAQLFGTALDSMTVQTSGNTFQVRLAIPEATIEQIADSGLASGHHGFKSAKPSQK